MLDRRAVNVRRLFAELAGATELLTGTLCAAGSYTSPGNGEVAG